MAAGRKWLEPAVYPILAVMGLAVVGAGWHLTKLANHPEVVLKKDGLTPWSREAPPAPPQKYLTVAKKAEQTGI